MVIVSFNVSLIAINDPKTQYREGEFDMQLSYQSIARLYQSVNRFIKCFSRFVFNALQIYDR